MNATYMEGDGRIYAHALAQHHVQVLQLKHVVIRGSEQVVDLVIVV